jgi:hypothetical protein
MTMLVVANCDDVDDGGEDVPGGFGFDPLDVELVAEYIEGADG